VIRVRAAASAEQGCVRANPAGGLNHQIAWRSDVHEIPIRFGEVTRFRVPADTIAMELQTNLPRSRPPLWVKGGRDPVRGYRKDLKGGLLPDTHHEANVANRKTPPVVRARDSKRDASMCKGFICIPFELCRSFGT